MSSVSSATAGPSRLLVRQLPRSLGGTTTPAAECWGQAHCRQRTSRLPIHHARNLHTTSVKKEEARQSAADEKAVDERASFHGDFSSLFSRQDAEMPADPVKRYEYLVAKGLLKADPHQKKIVEKLERLWKDLRTYDPGPIPDEPSELTPSFVSAPSLYAERRPRTHLLCSLENSSIIRRPTWLLQWTSTPSQRGCTSTARSARARQCSWTCFTRLCHPNSPAQSTARPVYTFTRLCSTCCTDSISSRCGTRSWGRVKETSCRRLRGAWPPRGGYCVLTSFRYARRFRFCRIS